MYLAVSLLFGGKVILEMHELEEQQEQSLFLRTYARITRWLLLRRADMVVVHSMHDAKLLNISNVRIIPHPIYKQVMRLNKRSFPKSFNILFFGLIRDYKGLPDLIEAYQMLEVEDKRLHIMGEMWDHVDIPDDPTINATLRYLKEYEVLRVFSFADVIVLPYTRASQSGVAHIAMDYGIPIVSTPVGGLIDALSGYAGWWPVRPNSPEDIADALYWIAKYRESERNFPIPEHLEDEKIVSKWKDLFTELSNR